MASSSRVKQDSIPLYLISGCATVWDAQAVATLHCQHGISGYRAGTLPGVSQQNAFLGLPLTLTPEETAWCILTGIAHLIPLDQSPSRPTLEEVETNTQRRLERIRRADEAATKERHKQAAIAKKAFANAGEEAQRKREARRKAKEEKRTKLANESGILDDFSEAQPRPPVDVLDVKTEKASSKDEQPISSPLAQYNHFHVVPSLPVIPSRLPTSPRITSLPHPIFPFPSGPRDRALVATFTALHAGGHMIGLGPRFGGEYLVYPGDYLRYHAHFTTQVLVRDECIKPTELVAWGRLGTGTKKAGLLCCWDDGRRNTGNQSRDEDTPGSASGQKDGEVEFYSLEWANFG